MDLTTPELAQGLGGLNVKELLAAEIYRQQMKALVKRKVAALGPQEQHTLCPFMALPTETTPLDFSGSKTLVPQEL